MRRLHDLSPRRIIPIPELRQPWHACGSTHPDHDEVKVRRPLHRQFLDPRNRDTGELSLEPLTPIFQEPLEIRERELPLRESIAALESTDDLGMVTREEESFTPSSRSPRQPVDLAPRRVA